MKLVSSVIQLSLDKFFRELSFHFYNQILRSRFFLYLGSYAKHNFLSNKLSTSLFQDCKKVWTDIESHNSCDFIQEETEQLALCKRIVI